MELVNENNPKNGLLRDLLVRGYASPGSDLCHADFEVKSLKSFCRACQNLDADFAKDIKDENGKLKCSMFCRQVVCSRHNGGHQGVA